MSRASAGVIGGGIYGVAAAIELAELGLDVTLYEQHHNILAGATASNFFRLHRGYHYPRDEQTARQALKGYTAFMGTFSEALTPGVPHYYAIAAEGSLTSAAQFLEHCGRLGLRATPVSPPFLVRRSVAACFETDEYYYDPVLLRACAWDRLNQFGVKVRLGHHRRPRPVQADVVVVTAYAGLNEALADLDCPPVELQYELCEVPVFSSPALDGLSVVVLDGPFCSVAPLGRHRHILYDVVHSVHARQAGTRSPVQHRSPSKFMPMACSADRFIALPGDMRHITSLWARRVVLPGVDATDARPYVISWASDRVLSVLSGKVSACVLAAREAAALVAERLGLPDPDESAAVTT